MFFTKLLLFSFHHVDVLAAAAEVMLVDPLNDVADIQQAVDSLAFDDADTNPMGALMTLMTHKISSLSLQQATSKKQNALLMASARKVGKPHVN